MTSPARLSAEAIRQLTMASDPWLSCDDCFDQLDEVVEATLTRGAPMREPFRTHLRACAVCQQEAYSLATLVAPDFDVDPSLAVAEVDSVLHDDPATAGHHADRIGEVRPAERPRGGGQLELGPDAGPLIP